MNDTPAIDPKQIWEVSHFKHDRQLLGCRFSPCGQYVVAAGTDNIVHRWQLESAKRTGLVGHGSWIGAMAFHPDAKRLITADYIGGIHCWPYADDAPKPTWTVNDAHHGAIRSIAINPNGQSFATVGHDHVVRVWSAENGRRLHEWTGHRSPVFCAAFHPDGTSLVTAEHFGVVKHWDTATGKLVRSLDASELWTDASLSGGAHSCGVRDVRFDASGKTLACSGLTALKDGDRRGGNASILWLDWKSGNRIKLLAAKGAGYAERFAFHSDELSMAACLTQDYGSLRFWKAGSVEPFHQLKSNCRDLDVHPDGSRIAVCEYVAHGKAGNNASTETLEEFQPNHGAIRIHSLAPKPKDS